MKQQSLLSIKEFKAITKSKVRTINRPTHISSTGYVTVFIQPMSVNEAYTGRRFKTKEYKQYSRLVQKALPPITLPGKPYKLFIIWGVSNQACDVDNPAKAFTDLLQQFYGFNDKHIYELHLKKQIVKKGEEFIKFLIEKC